MIKKFFATLIKAIILCIILGIIGILFKIVIIDGYLLNEDSNLGETTLQTVTISDIEAEENRTYEPSLTQQTQAALENIQTSTVAEQEEIDYNKYFYLQLDENAKLIYDEFEKNIENLKTGNYIINMGKTFNDFLQQEGGQESLNISFQSALDAFKLDRPDVFFLDITKIYMTTSTKKLPLKTTYEISFGPTNGGSYLNQSFSSKSEIDQQMQAIENIVGNINIRTEVGDYSKVKSVHDWLVDNVEYDTSISLPGIYEIWGALDRKTAVCEGYAKSFKYIMDQLNIPCVIVKGIGTNSSNETEAHAWNYVMIDQKWYAIDTTWDDPVVIGGGTATRESKYKFFCKGAVTFAKDHFPDGKMTENGMTFEYPILNNADY